MPLYLLYLKYLIYTLELLALFTGVLAWKRSRPVAIRRITLLLPFTILVEGYGEIFRIAGNIPSPVAAYNLYSLGEMLCWFAFFYEIFPSPRRRKIIIFLGMSYLAFAVVEFCTYHKWLHEFHTDSYRLYCIYIMGLAVLYLSDIMQYKSYHPLQKDAVFWLCAGALIFQSVFFVHLTVLNIASFRSDFGSIMVWNIVLYFAEILYYGLLCVAFFISWRFASSGRQPSSNP